VVVSAFPPNLTRIFRMWAPAAPAIQTKMIAKLKLCQPKIQGCQLQEAWTSDRLRFMGSSRTSSSLTVHGHYIVSGSTPTNVCLGSKADMAG
jgi:hypothetical protein